MQKTWPVHRMFGLAKNKSQLLHSANWSLTTLVLKTITTLLNNISRICSDFWVKSVSQRRTALLTNYIHRQFSSLKVMPVDKQKMNCCEKLSKRSLIALNSICMLSALVAIIGGVVVKINLGSYLNHLAVGKMYLTLGDTYFFLVKFLTISIHFYIV